MALHKGVANQGKSNHKSTPTHKMTKHQHVTKPESRHPTTHSYSVSSAESQIKKVHS